MTSRPTLGGVWLQGGPPAVARPELGGAWLQAVAATGGSTYTLTAATYVPGSITATGVTPRITVTVA